MIFLSNNFNRNIIIIYIIMTMGKNIFKIISLDKIFWWKKCLIEISSIPTDFHQLNIYYISLYLRYIIHFLFY